MHKGASRSLSGALALLLLGACTTGPPFWHDLPALHHDPFPAPSEREARFTRIKHYGSPQECEERLEEVASHGVVRISSYEAIAHVDTAHQGRAVIEEHACAEGTLRVRAWYAAGGEDGHGGETAHR